MDKSFKNKRILIFIHERLQGTFLRNIVILRKYNPSYINENIPHFIYEIWRHPTIIPPYINENPLHFNHELEYKRII